MSFIYCYKVFVQYNMYKRTKNTKLHTTYALHNPHLTSYILNFTFKNKKNLPIKTTLAI